MQTLYVIACVLPALVAFFWTITLLLNQEKSGNPKRWLGLFMLMTLLLYGCHALVFLHEYHTYFHLKFLYHFAGLSVYPLFYNYIELMSVKERISKRFYLHFVPAFGIAFLMLVMSLQLDEVQIRQYIERIVLHRTHMSMDNSFALQVLYNTYKLGRVIFAVQVLAYTYLSYQLIRKYHRFILNFYSDLSAKNIRWLHILIILMFGIGILGFIFNIIGRSYFTHENLVFYPSLIFGILLYGIGLQGNQHVSYVAKLQEDLWEEEDMPTQERIELDKDSFDSEFYLPEIIHQKLKKLMESDKVFLNPHLKITDITQMIGTNRTYVSQVINEIYQMHFNDFINYYRIQYAKEIIRNPQFKHYSFAAIAEESGFGSLSTFNRSFRKLEKCTPQEFRANSLK